MRIDLKVTGSDAVKATLQGIGRQAPFAMATSLNALADEAQQAVQEGLAGRFTLRRSTFVKQTIYRAKGRDFATKTKLQATVRVNPARDFLVQHEEGGIKRAQSGVHVAIPLPAVKPTEATVVERRLRPSKLLANPQVRKITTPAGTFLVRNRPGRGRGGLNGWRTEFLYELKRGVPLRPRLAFYETTQRVINASWDRHLMVGIDRALRSAR